MNNEHCSTSRVIDLQPYSPPNELNEDYEPYGNVQVQADDIETLEPRHSNQCPDNNKVTKFFPSVPAKMIPYIGAQFETYEKAYEAYNLYARNGGFSIKKLTSKKNRGIIRWGQFACNKHGVKKQKGQEETTKSDIRCGCKARIIVKLDPSTKKWVVTMHEMEHNHLLHTPSKINMHRSTRGLNSPNQKVVKSLFASGLKPSKIMNVMAMDVGGIEYASFNREQVNSYLRKSRKMLLGKDCQIALQYFQTKSLQSPDFYYAIQTNEDGQVENLFWADAIARENYFYFSDVISFDTTYKKNKYLMSFAPFVGVNNHFQSIVVGCALLVDEKKESFVWVFNEWMKAMDDRPPKAMITDQDPAMKAAIKEVFPNTMHRVCKWHIMQNAPRYISHLHVPNSDFTAKWDTWFWSSDDKEEFERRWLEMTMLYPQMLQVKWLNDLWADRFSWASQYSPDIFMTGISTTQRSESINAMFKCWLDATTPMHTFVEQFELAIEKQRHEEKHLDFKMKNIVLPSVGVPLLLYIQDKFTPTIFKKFEKEYEKVLHCHPLIEHSKEDSKLYKVLHYQPDGSEKEYMLTYYENSHKISACRCRLWSFEGIVCCHMFSVFKVERVHRLPEYYILKRWTKQAKIGSIQHLACKSMVGEGSSIVQKKHVFFFKVHKCLQHALKFDEVYNEALIALDGLNIKLEEKVNTLEKPCNNVVGETSDLPVIRSTDVSGDKKVFLRDREPVRAKGSTKRIASGINGKKTGRICKSCRRPGHDSRTCPHSMKNVKRDNMLCDTNIKPIRRCNACGGLGHDKRNCAISQGTSGGGS